MSPTPYGDPNGEAVWELAFVAGSLFPEDPGDVTCPGLLGLWAAGLQDVSVPGFPPSKPDLKAQATLPRVLR